MKYFFYLPLFFTTHMPLKTNLLWISQVCLLPKTCNNSLNLLIPPQQVSCLCQQGSSPLLSEMPIMAPPHRWGNGDSVLWRDSSQGIQIVGRSSGLQHQLSSILMLCCCWNCLILVETGHATEFMLGWFHGERMFLTSYCHVGGACES